MKLTDNTSNPKYDYYAIAINELFYFICRLRLFFMSKNEFSEYYLNK